jgi:hypothetical protein
MAELATHRLGGVLDAYVAVKPLVASTFRAVLAGIRNRGYSVKFTGENRA